MLKYVFFGQKTEGLLETPESFVDARVEGIHRVTAGGHVYIEVKNECNYIDLMIPTFRAVIIIHVIQTSTGENFIGI